MNPIRIFCLITALFSFCAHAQESSTLIQVRAAYHNPVKPFVELYMPDQTGTVVKLNLVAEGLSKPQIATPVNGNLVLYTQAQVDPKNPEASLAASIKIPENIKRAVVIIFPAAKETDKPPYRMVVLDDSPTVFKKGESRAINLTTVEAAMQAGEHKLSLPSGKVTAVPAVSKVDEFNMAQTNFYYKEAESWVPFTERQLQYLDTTRRIFLLYLTPGSKQPFVTTIVDNQPEKLPEVPK